MDIITRAEWGARPPKSTPVKIHTPTPELWLHHTASSGSGGAARVKQIQDFHMDVRRWNDIAYSFLVDLSGDVYEGRGAGIRGGHTRNHNSISHAICVLGHYDMYNPTDAALTAVADLVRHGASEGWWPNQLTGGHRDASGASTSCPGKNLHKKIPGINKAALEDELTPEQSQALDTLVALLKSRPSDSPPWGGANWSAYLDEVWTGPVTSDPGPLNPVTHIQLAKVYGVLKEALKKAVPSADVDAVIAEIVDRLEQ